MIILDSKKTYSMRVLLSTLLGMILSNWVNNNN